MSPPPSPASSRSPTASGSAAASSALPGRPAPGLPVVDPEAAALSHQLSARIAQVIDEAGGWLPFDRYMAMALYEPGLGYYANGRPVFGAAGDFVTAPELTPLFGDAIARQLAVWFGEPAAAMALRAADDGPPMILEFGAGSGVLAAQLLNALDRLGVTDVQYRILELSADLQARQRRTIETRVPALLDRVHWLTALPEHFRGIVIGNEVLDAMPVRLFEQSDDGLMEVGVVRAATGGFTFGARAADASMRAHRDDIASRGVSVADWLSPYRSEVAPQQAAWLASVADSMASGIVLLIDYGFPTAEYYHPQRAGGTLMGHLRHRSHPDPFVWPGLSDITAHVDFGALAAAGVRQGLSPIGYLSQARFLLNCGLLDAFGDLPRDEQKLWFAQAQAVQRLVSEAEMGELFKVIAFAKGVAGDLAWPGFGQGDRLHRLLGQDPD